MAVPWVTVTFHLSTFPFLSPFSPFLSVTFHFPFPGCQKAKLRQLLEALRMNPQLRPPSLMQPEHDDDVRKTLDSFKPFCPAFVNLNRAAEHPTYRLKHTIEIHKRWAK